MKKERKTHPKEELGITLVALVITVIVLLILAGAAINMAINSEGLFGKANEAVEEWNSAVGEEENQINNLIGKLEELTPNYEPMITKWNIESGDEISIYLYTPTDYNGNPLPNNTNITIDWGDGTEKTTYTSSNLQYDERGGFVTYTYEQANNNTTIEIKGECNVIAIYMLPQLTSIEQWGYTGTIKYWFEGCSNLTTIASPSKDTFRNVTDFSYTFSDCTSLSSIPEGLFANCDNVTDFSFTFSGCTNLQGEAIPLWERVENGAENGYKGVPNGSGCYCDCTQLSNYSSIPNYWRSESLV